jgi:PEP-CTERM motif
MKLRISFLTVLFLALLAAPAMADVVYENGPVNGTVDAWNISNGYVVSNSYICNTCLWFLEIAFWVWLLPGDTLTSVEASITSEENGGTVYVDGVLNTTLSNCFSNQYGYNVCEATAYEGQSHLVGAAGWLNLQNAQTPNGDPVYWDENSGFGCQSSGCPSSASESAIGTIPSEAFTMSWDASGTTPEPTSIMLFGSGVLGLAGALRRRLF